MRNIAVTSILVLLVVILTGFPAAAETVIQINGGLPVQTQDEALLMIAGAARDYLQDPEVAAELEAEITSREFSSPPGRRRRKSPASTGSVRIILSIRASLLRP